jgi:glycerophosphoryl diester phosphodiesterase
VLVASTHPLLDSSAAALMLQVGYVVMNQTNEARMAGMDEVLRLAPPEVVAAHYGMVDEPLVNKVKSADKQLYTWTVNDVGAIQQVLSAGVDGIVTNRPKLVKDAIDWQLQRCYQVVGDVVDMSKR